MKNPNLDQYQRSKCQHAIAAQSAFSLFLFFLFSVLSPLLFFIPP